MMIHPCFNGGAKTLALGVILALVAGAAEARDHRGPTGTAGGGVTVSNTPARYGHGRNPVIRDHRAGCTPTRQVPRPCGIPRLGRNF